MDEDQDDELQMALAMSLQEYNNTQSPPAPSDAAEAGPSKPSPAKKQRFRTKPLDDKVKSPQAEAEGEAPPSAPSPPAVASGAAQKPARKRGKKLPQFAPSETEINACFRELASNGRSQITIVDIMETGTKLGLELDHQKVRTMLEYLGDNRLGTNVQRTGAISLQDFKEIAEHFRVE